MHDTSLTPAVTRIIAAVGALVSFQEPSQLLAELAGVRVDANHVQRAAEALGEEIALPLPTTLYLGIDSTGVSV